MSNKRINKAYVRYDGSGRVIPGSLILNRFKPAVGNWSEISAYECCNPSPLALRLIFDNIENANLLVGDVTDVNNWNTFFDLPTYGSPFTSVEVVGDEIRLLGGSNIVVREYLLGGIPIDPNDQPLFFQNVGLVSIDDSISCIIEVQEGAFFCGYKNIINGFSSDAIGKNGVDGNYAFLSATGGVGLDAFFEVNVSGGIVDDIQLGDLGGGGLNYQIGDTLTILGGQFGGVDGVDDITITVTSLYNTGQTLTSVNLPACILISNFTPGHVGAFQNCTELATINMPLLEEAFSTFIDLFSLTTINLPNLITAGDFCFNGCTSLTTVLLPSLTTAGEYFFNNCTSLTTLDLPNLTTAGISCFDTCPSLQTIDLPSLTTVGDYSFAYSTSLTTISLPVCTDLGATVGNDSVFFNIIGNTITLTVPSALMTCDAGSPDGDIVYLQANNTVTVVTV